VNELLEIEKIKRLKGRYLRGLDTNDWDMFEATMSEDCSGRYSGGKLSFDSRRDIVEYMKENLGGDKMLTMHQCHHPEIDFSDEENATGTWYLQDIVLALEFGVRIYGSAVYKDSYRKIDGQWLIAATGYHRVFEASEPLGEQHSVLQNMFSQ